MGKRSTKNIGYLATSQLIILSSALRLSSEVNQDDFSALNDFKTFKNLKQQFDASLLNYFTNDSKISPQLPAGGKNPN